MSLLRFHRDVFIVLLCTVVGLAQVTVANHENSDFSPSDCPPRLPRGRGYWVLPRAVDPPHDHLFRPYVPYTVYAVEGWDT